MLQILTSVYQSQCYVFELCDRWFVHIENTSFFIDRSYSIYELVGFQTDRTDYPDKISFML